MAEDQMALSPEFLAIAAMVVLTIFLRQRGSPESKPVASAHSSTGE